MNRRRKRLLFRSSASLSGLTVNTPQGVFGKFIPVQDTSVTNTVNNIQSVFGKFTYIMDNSNVRT